MNHLAAPLPLQHNTRPPVGLQRGEVVGTLWIGYTEKPFQILYGQHNPVSQATASHWAAGQRHLQLRVLPDDNVRHLRHPAINNMPYDSRASWEQSQHLAECDTHEEQ